MVFVFLSLTYFTKHNTLQVHPCCCIWEIVIFNEWVLVYCMCCCYSVVQSCPTICHTIDCSKPGLSVPHCLPKFAQVHVHCISDPIQPSQLLSPLFPCAFSLCQHQGLFQLVGWSRQVTKYWSFSFSISPSNEYSGLISFRTDWFELLYSKRLSRVFSGTTVQKHQFFRGLPPLWVNSQIHTWLLEKP